MSDASRFAWFTQCDAVCDISEASRQEGLLESYRRCRTQTPASPCRALNRFRLGLQGCGGQGSPTVSMNSRSCRSRVPEGVPARRNARGNRTRTPSSEELQLLCLASTVSLRKHGT